MKNIFIILLIGTIIISCAKKEEKLPDNVFYTCSMDPQIMEKKPGKCPICKMELTKVTVDKNQMNGLKMSDEQMELANVRTEEVDEGWIGEEKVLNAQIVANENYKQKISSRLDGRIEKLYFKNTGETVKQGDVLYEIYSEELLSTFREYVMALEKENQSSDVQVDYSKLREAAKNKLLLWGLTESQIKSLATSPETRPTVPILSKTNGTVTKINVKQGEYVTMGMDLFELTDFSNLWVEAQLFANEIQDFSYNDEAMVRISGIPDLDIKGKIDFILPELQPQSKVVLVRIGIPNKDLLLKPGMQAYITLKSNEHKALLVNANAVLEDSKGNSVWVKKNDGTFQIKMIEVGVENSGMFEVTSGLKQGDEVVVSGAYLLNSEYIFKKGASPMEGHDMSKM
jgi:membrane fusion protein, copper/silver efflux system